MPRLEELRQLGWGKRNTTIRDRIAEKLASMPATWEWSASVLQQLPVPPTAAEKKKALIADLKLASRDYKALLRKVESLAKTVKGLPVVDDSRA